MEPGAAMLSRSSDGSLNEEADVLPAVMASTESSGGGGGGIELMVNKPFSKQIGSLLTAVLNAQSKSQLSLRARVRRRTDRLHRPPRAKKILYPENVTPLKVLNRKVTAINLTCSLNYPNRSRRSYKLMQKCSNCRFSLVNLDGFFDYCDALKPANVRFQQRCHT